MYSALLNYFLRRGKLAILAAACAGMVALVCSGCAHGRSYQYPPFPDQAKRVEDPTKARVYLLRPAGGLNAQAGFNFYGVGPAATGPRVDPRQWLPATPQLGIYPQNPSPASPFRMIGQVASGSYLCWEEPPRLLTLATYQNKTNSITPLQLEAGNVYYLRATIRDWVGRAHVDILGEVEGQELLKKCRPPADYQGGNQN